MSDYINMKHPKWYEDKKQFMTASGKWDEEEKDELKPGDGLFLLLILFVLIPISSVANGFMISTLWGWFVAPALGVNAITLFQGMGLGLFVGLLKPSIRNDKKKISNGELTKKAVEHLIFFNGLVLGYGWLIHKLMQ